MRFLLLTAALMAGAPVLAATTPDSLLSGYVAEARRDAPAYAPSAQRGGAFFRSTHGSEWSCSTCHGSDPSQAGRHARTNKTIAPLAPQANTERFTDAAKVEKWFGRNCGDVVGRPCTAQEKADVIAFLRAGSGGRP